MALFRWMGGIFLSLVLVWALGFAWFYREVPYPRTYPDRGEMSDAIVVLTGGMGRIKAGLELLEKGRAPVLLISGVDSDVRPEDIRKQYTHEIAKPGIAQERVLIYLDYVPRDTIGNAVQTARWMKEAGYGKIHLVTSTYHMPRSLLEFQHNLPDAQIIPIAVAPDRDQVKDVVMVKRGALRLIFIEYHKFLLRKLDYALPQQWQVMGARLGTERQMEEVVVPLPEAMTETLPLTGE